jgi:hypothetical protein
MYGASCTVYYPDQQIHNIHINNILYIISTPTCFNVSTSSSGNLNIVLCSSYKIIKGRLKKFDKMQQYADIYILLNYSTCFRRPSCPSSGVHKTLVAASGTDHTIWGVSKLYTFSSRWISST